MTNKYVRNALLLAALLLVPAQMFAGVFISVAIAPPALPVYVQPVCPAPGYIWTPGYWAYGPDGYYWVPGTWVLAPEPGLLWTPGYWGWSGALYVWHAGYWGPHVGFYGGVNYGFGYSGVGFGGGLWVGGMFRYNTAVSNVNVAIVHNTYVDRTVIVNSPVNHASFNGPNGVMARPTPQEEAYGRERHVAASQAQVAHEHVASMDRNNFASVNHGRPATAAMARPMSHAAINDRPPGAQHGAMAPAHPAGNQGAPASHGAPQHAAEAQHKTPPPHNAAEHQQHAPARHEGHEGH